MLKNYKELNIWQKSYKLYLHIYGDFERMLKALIKYLKPFLPTNYDKTDSYTKNG